MVGACNMQDGIRNS